MRCVLLLVAALAPAQGQTTLTATFSHCATRTVTVTSVHAATRATDCHVNRFSCGSGKHQSDDGFCEMNSGLDQVRACFIDRCWTAGAKQCGPWRGHGVASSVDLWMDVHCTLNNPPTPPPAPYGGGMTSADTTGGVSEAEEGNAEHAEHAGHAEHADNSEHATPEAPPCSCTAWVGQHFHGGGELGGNGHSHTYGPTSTPITDELHEHQASSLRVTGTPGCNVVLQCNAGRSHCTYHGNSYCGNSQHSLGPCLNMPDGWRQVVTVPASGTIQLVMQHNDPAHATLTLNPECSGVSGDPFVTYMGKKTQVWLPLEKEISLLQCNSWELRGTAFGSGVAGDSQQWFRGLSLRARGAEQLRVEAGTKQLEVTAVPHGFFNYTKRAETVTAAAAGTDLEFVYARVTKDAAGGRMHVDLKINKLDESACHGSLPEIWGLVPMSEATAAMLLPPKPQA